MNNIKVVLRTILKKIRPELGIAGEDLAVKFLRKKGYIIIERNFRLRGGEIDIIAKDGDQLVFTEVKTRNATDREFIMASISKDKQRKIHQTALYYISKNKCENFSGRFDVIFVEGASFRRRIYHIENAF